MTIEDLQSELGLDELEDSFRRGWPASERSYPNEGLPFLSEPFIRTQASLASIDDDGAARLVATGRRAQWRPALCRLLWHEHRIYTGRDVPERGAPGVAGPPSRRIARPRRRAGLPVVAFLDEEHDASGFPDLTPAAGDDAPTLNLLLALSAVPGLVSFCEQRHVPEAIMHDTLSDLALWLRYYRERLGIEGINAGTLSWFRFHLQGRLFRLGRLQFMQGGFTRDFTVYRGRRSGSVRALAASGLTVDEDGLLLFGPDDATNRARAWVTERRVTPGAVYGNPVSSDGRILREEVGLEFEEYLPLLQHRTPVLEVHIPEGEPMSTASCAESFRRAVEFFTDHFPERAFRGFTCESWFLGRELLDLLRPDSNMRAFADELYLYPCLGGRDDTLARVFGPAYREIASDLWPRKTKLQRSIIDHLARGGSLRQGGGFILTEDLPWGGRPYRGLL